MAVYSHDTSEQVAEYTYDSWGNDLTATGTLANINPFCYRSYYRDADVELCQIGSALAQVQLR